MDLTKQLLPQEQADLDRYEHVIERGLKTFYEVGEALERIRVGTLYRQTHATFEEYCAQRWGIGDRRARQLRDAAKVMSDLAENVVDNPVDETGTPVPVSSTGLSTKSLLPETERQARPLAALETPVERREAWEKAVEDADGQQPTASQVSAAVVAVRQPEPPLRPHPLPIQRLREEEEFADDVPITDLDGDDCELANEPCTHGWELLLYLQHHSLQVWADETYVSVRCAQCDQEYQMMLTPPWRNDYDDRN